MVINRQNKNSKNQKSKIKMIRLHSQIRKAFQGRSRGFTLIEVVIAIAFIGVISIAFLSALSTASTVLVVADERATAESLARSQMEYVKNQSKSETYPPSIPPAYQQAGYSANITTGEVPLRAGLQRITIIIAHDDEPLVTLVGYKLFL
jgi:prepilin-type N-terminal cleavage/methylation domain-containing protein